MRYDVVQNLLRHELRTTVKKCSVIKQKYDVNEPGQFMTLSTAEMAEIIKKYYHATNSKKIQIWPDYEPCLRPLSIA